MINEATPNVPLTVRHRCFERSIITNIYPGKSGLRVFCNLRVSNGTPKSRNEISEAQPMEIELRPVLLMGEHSRDEPTFSWS
jgi:hypothetical protein